MFSIINSFFFFLFSGLLYHLTATLGRFWPSVQLRRARVSPASVGTQRVGVPQQNHGSPMECRPYGITRSLMIRIPIWSPHLVFLLIGYTVSALVDLVNRSTLSPHVFVISIALYNLIAFWRGKHTIRIFFPSQPQPNYRWPPSVRTAVPVSIFIT
ncbi:hypothetical protein BJV78DRAFT_494707 [Lactifluus subvellereus]|nr:hypothetical protein BJV78DRAFT_494707 [Lactifluus subvellereus]